MPKRGSMAHIFPPYRWMGLEEFVDMALNRAPEMSRDEAVKAFHALAQMEGRGAEVDGVTMVKVLM